MSPRPRLSARIVVQEQDHLPDLVFAKKVLPDRHRRNPGRGLSRQARPARGNAPEQERFLQLRDGADVLKIQRRRVQSGGIRPLAVELVTVAILAVPDIDVAALADELFKLIRIFLLVFAEGVLQGRQVEALAIGLEFARRRGMDGAQLDRRLVAGQHARVYVIAGQQRHDDEDRVADPFLRRVLDQRLDRADQFLCALLGEGERHERAGHHEDHVHGEQALRNQLSQ